MRELGTVALAAIVGLWGCGSGSTATDGGLDGSTPDGSGDCRSDFDCSDGLFCNGEEVCARAAPGADENGCIPAEVGPCMPTQECDEPADSCETVCDVAEDADGDGRVAIACGGDDCDDADPNRFPGNPEVCDAEDHDDDCDPETFGFRDLDSDGFSSGRCCNEQSDGTALCGTDCDDMNPNLFPRNTEACDGFDNDCDGTIDEGVVTTYYADADGDGFGSDDPAAETTLACSTPIGFADRREDCDDANATVNPGNPERCDAMMIDENCDGVANPEALCSCAGAGSRPCTLLGRCEGSTQTCVDGSWSECSITPIPETCNMADDDCDGVVDDGVTILCFADLDSDGFALATAIAAPECPDPLRVAFGQCPVQTTNRAPVGANVDCDDADSMRRPGAVEVCDAARVDEDCDGVANPPALCDCSDDEVQTPCRGADGVTPLPGICGLPGTQRTCIAGTWGLCSQAPLTETCDDPSSTDPGFDQDCDGVVDDGVTATCYTDLDQDTYAVVGAAPVERCPDASRAFVGGCPARTTNRAPAATEVDCDDSLADVYPGSPEVCDGVDSNCSSGGGAAPEEDADSDLHSASDATCLGQGEAGAPASAYPKDDCDDTESSIFGGPTAPDDASSCNDVDDDCDPSTSELTASCAGGGYCQQGASCEPGRGALQVEAGESHTCAVLRDGSLQCWGLNANGRLGDGTTLPRAVPTPVASLSGVQEVAAGNHTCARLANGSVHCWGPNDFGQLGDGTTSSGRRLPEPVSGLAGALGLAAGMDHTCSHLVDGSVRCWGANGSGQLGDGTTSSRDLPTIVTTATGDLMGVVELAAGAAHSCARLADGTVACWGSNERGQLGDGTFAERRSATAVPALADVVELVAGSEHTCARLADGTARCWGTNGTSQLGDGTTTLRANPTPVSTLAGAAALAAGTFHSCAALSDGGARCWGRNGFGQLGDGTTFDRSTPAVVVSLPNVVELTAGRTHSCARLEDHTIRCWGLNLFNQLGDGTTEPRSQPTPVQSLGFHVEQVVLGSRHSCARLGDGTAKCWGDNRFGQLGDATTTDHGLPADVVSLAGTVELAGQGNHSCVRFADGAVQCWGMNDTGQLGDGTTTDRPTPTPTMSLTGAAQIAVGSGHSCARLADGSARCWGDNARGQLGDGTTTRRLLPVVVGSLTGAVELVAGGWHSCARTGASVLCWGQNNGGQLGDGTTIRRRDPTLVGSITGTVTGLTAGSLHTCARLSDGTARCWGNNALGQLGDGSTLNRTSPTVVSGLANALTLVAGDIHTCAVLGDGTARCWGANTSGQLGDGTTTQRLSPTAVPALGEVVGMGAGGTHTCSFQRDGTVSCWGRGSEGQLGDGGFMDLPSPTPIWSL